MSTFIQNVMTGNGEVEEQEALPMPTYNFARRDQADWRGNGNVAVDEVEEQEALALPTYSFARLEPAAQDIE